jgi:hypothetical protein
MADAFVIIRYPNESLKDFNARLRRMCDSAAVTSFDAAIVDEQLAITLLCEMEDATEDDVTEDKAQDPASELKVGDSVPAGVPLLVQASSLRAHTSDAADRSERLAEKLLDRLGNDIESARYIQAPIDTWIPDLSHAKRRPDGSLELKDDLPQSVDGSPLPYVLAHRTCTYLVVAAPHPEVGGADEDGASE